MGIGEVIGIVLAVCGGIFIIIVLLINNASKRQKMAIQRRLQAESQSGFSADETLVVDPAKEDTIYLDYRHRQGAHQTVEGGVIKFMRFPLDKIVEASLIQDGTVVHKNAVAPAMIGAYFLGWGGALAGATAMSNDAHVGVLAVRILLDDMQTSSMVFTVLAASTNKADPNYQRMFVRAQEIYAKFEGIVRFNEQERRRQGNAQSTQPAAPQNSPAVSAQRQAAAQQVAQQLGIMAQQKAAVASARTAQDDVFARIRELAKLKDEGIISEQEFEAKKKQLMDKI